MPKFRKIIKDIQKDRFVRLGDIAQFSKETSDYSEYESGEFKYLEISGVSLGLNKYRTTTVSVSNAPSRAKMKTQDGDIVIALTRPHRGAIAQIKESGVISSTGFSVIRKVVTQIDREWLLFVLLSNLSLQQMLQRSSGGNYPAIIEDEVKRIYIPIVDYSKQLQMAANMRTKAKEFDAQIQTSNSFLNNTLFILERVGLTFDKDNNNLAFALSNALNDAKPGENGTLLISSGLLFLLVALYYNIEISSPSADAVQYKDRLLTWSEKYQITDAQIDTEQNAASNAECIEAIFNRYVRSTEQTIFMSRCFSAEYNETENAIRRAINEINNEKKTGIMLIRVDEHHEGTTGQISDRIFRDIESAGLVIADLSSGKLNVPHEIGYAMGLKKDLILVHNGTSEEAEKHIPSNIRMFEQIRFNGDYQTLQNEIKRRLIDYYKL